MVKYTDEDCVRPGEGCPWENCVVVLLPDALSGDQPGQLFFSPEGSNPDPAENSLDLVSLSNGERYQIERREIMGTLKPERLPEEAKLQLSQIRPYDAGNPSIREPQYSGYCFLQDGKYASGVWLGSPEEVEAYVRMQMPYQHRILICDRDDLAVMEVQEGQVVFPMPGNSKGFLQGAENGMKVT